MKRLLIAGLLLTLALAASIALKLRAQAAHAPPGESLALGDDLLAVPPRRRLPGLEAAWAEARRSRPELLALAATEEQLKRRARSTRSGTHPRLDAVGQVLTANPNPRYQPALDELRTTWRVGFEVSYTPNDTATFGAERDRFRAEARAVAADRGAFEDAIRAEVARSLHVLTQSATQIDTAKRSLEAATTAYQVRQSEYRAGEATSTALTDAETELTRARLELADALIDARVAGERFDHALGRTR